MEEDGRAGAKLLCAKERQERRAPGGRGGGVTRRLAARALRTGAGVGVGVRERRRVRERAMARLDWQQHRVRRASGGGGRGNGGRGAHRIDGVALVLRRRTAGAERRCRRGERVDGREGGTSQ